MRRAAKGSLNEHLPERALTVADVEKRDRAYDFLIKYSNPKIACASLIESWDIKQIRLVGQTYRDLKFLSLHRQDY